MLKSLFSGIIFILTAVIAVVGTKVCIYYFLVNLGCTTNPVFVLGVLTVVLFIFFAFYLGSFLGWFHARTRKNFGGRTFSNRIIESAITLFGAVIGALILGSFGAMLTLAQKVDTTLCWILLVIFMILLFSTAFRQDKRESRMNRSDANWWKG